MPAVDITEKTEFFERLPNLESFPRLKSIVFRTIAVAMAGILAMVVPKFGLFINLMGAFSCTALAFIMPILLYNKAFDSSIGDMRR